MFYQEKEIIEHLTCPFCKNRYNDPRILPCSLSICYDCIQLLAINQNGTLKCVCSNIHQIPPEGFLPNTGLAKLAEKIPNEVYRSEEVETFKLSLSGISQKLNCFKKDLNLGKDKITEYCNAIKNEVQLKTEIVMAKIQQHLSDTIKKVDDYENECLLKYENNCISASQYNEELMNAEDFLKKWTTYLSNYSILDKDVSVAKKDSEMPLEKLAKKYDEFQSKLFDGNLIKFADGDDKNGNEIDFNMLIGNLIHENLNLTDSIKQINNRKIVNCRNYLDKNFLSRKIKFIDLRHNEIFALHEQIDHNILNILTIDYEGNLIKKLNIPYPGTCNKIAYSTIEKIEKSNSLELLYVFSCYRTTNKEKSYFGRVYDQNLNLLLEKEIQFNLNSVFIYKENIYCLFCSKQGLTNMLSVYNGQLTEIERYGQSNKNFPFHFPENTKIFLVNENYYILFCDNYDHTIIIMNKIDGNVVKSFKTELVLDHVNLYMDRYIINYNKICSQNDVLYAFDLNSLDDIEKTKMKYEINISKGKRHLLDISGTQLTFFDNTNYAINF